MKEKGVIFVASGEKYVEEVRDSLKRLKSVMPEIDATFYTDRNLDVAEADQVIVEEDLDRDYSAKIKKMKESPYEKTIFLDSEVKVEEDFSEIFEVLEDFQMAFSFKNGTIQGESMYGMDMSYNTGVIAYRDDEVVQNFFSDWLEAYRKEREEYHDQTSFFNSIVKSDVRYITLPFEYNYRLQYSCLAHGEIKIFHFREEEMPGFSLISRNSEKIIKKINSKRGRRVSVPSLTGVKIISEKDFSEITRFFGRIRKEGLMSTLQVGVSRYRSGEDIFQ